MNVNKKFDRLRQWGKEKMGADGGKTDTPDDFKALETEMSLRHDGLERLQKSMNAYVKSLSKRTEGEEKERYTPVAYLGTTMSRHGEEFEDGAKIGECLISFGQAHEKIGRMQETYASNASSSWLESLERSLAQMKDYQAARKRLESRRLAYDASLAKMQKAKKEDYRAEEELRSQKAKYEESTDEVYTRMHDIIDTEPDTIADLQSFLAAELTYHDRCREVLLQLQQSWPGGPPPSNDFAPPRRPTPRSRTSTLNSLTLDTDAPLAPPDPPFRTGTGSSRTPSRSSSPLRAATLPERPPPVSRTPTDSSILSARSQLRRTASPFDDSRAASPERIADVRAASPATEVRSAKPPPPPPPSRSTKPPPPPPPMKRSTLGAAAVATY